MHKPFVGTAVLACLAAGTVLLLGLNAASLEGHLAFDGDAILLPLVISGTSAYEMELHRTEPGSLDFRRVRSTEVVDTHTAPPAVLKNNTLRIPVLQAGDITYRLELRRVDGDSELFTLISAAVVNEPQQGYAVLPTGRGGFNYEPVFLRDELSFDKARSLAAFKETLYPLLRLFHKKNGSLGGFNDPRLNVGSSCIGCHIDGMNRLNNSLRAWLDESTVEGSSKLPKGPYGVDGWINDNDIVSRVNELYPPSSVVRGYVEDGRRTFLGSMAQIKQAMILGLDKNVYVEPVIWTVEYVQRRKYRYPQTTSN